MPSFRPNPLAARALALVLPDGPVADLACGPSGSALLAAKQGRRVTAVDVSEVALGLLDAEARRRGLGHLITLVHADLSGWAPEPRSHALVLATGFWDAAVFATAAAAVANGGLLAWEALTAEPAERIRTCPPSGAFSRVSPRPSSRRATPCWTRARCPAARAAGCWPAASVDLVAVLVLSRQRPQRRVAWRRKAQEPRP